MPPIKYATDSPVSRSFIQGRERGRPGKARTEAPKVKSTRVMLWGGCIPPPKKLGFHVAKGWFWCILACFCQSSESQCLCAMRGQGIVKLQIISGEGCFNTQNTPSYGFAVGLMP